MIPMIFHRNLTAERWQQFSLLEQLGNIGSEVGRALQAKRTENVVRMNGALDRGLELFDLTIADPKHRNRLRELCRAREVVCDFFFGDNEYQSTEQSLEGYFMVFALAARMHR